MTTTTSRIDSSAAEAAAAPRPRWAQGRDVAAGRARLVADRPQPRALLATASPAQTSRPMAAVVTPPRRTPPARPAASPSSSRRPAAGEIDDLAPKGRDITAGHSPALNWSPAAAGHTPGTSRAYRSSSAPSASPAAPKGSAQARGVQRDRQGPAHRFKATTSRAGSPTVRAQMAARGVIVADGRPDLTAQVALRRIVCKGQGRDIAAGRSATDGSAGSCSSTRSVAHQATGDVHFAYI